MNEAQVFIARVVTTAPEEDAQLLVDILNSYFGHEGRVQPGDGPFTYAPLSQVYFRAGLLACREYMARFVEAENPAIAQSIRANWWPQLGPDPGPPRRYEFSEVAEEKPEGGWKHKPISASTEALAVALGFIGERVMPATAPRPPERPELEALLKKSVAAFKALSPEQQEEHLRLQRESWVRGEMGMGSDRDEAEYRAAMSATAPEQTDGERS